MTAKIIDGKAIADRLRAEYRLRIDDLRSRHGVTPALAVILVGDNPASRSYVRGKIAGCKQVGIRSELIELPLSVRRERAAGAHQALNEDPAIHGILVQLPLPPQIRVASVVEQISVEKDVDGFHLYNMGGLVTATRCSRRVRRTACRRSWRSSRFRSKAATSWSSVRAISSASRRR
jgi:methylenetetrahydrofolate dehydrogenase (NADP+)/methenyltetrahydrofolate cyclohydrolase